MAETVSTEETDADTLIERETVDEGVVDPVDVKVATRLELALDD